MKNNNKRYKAYVVVYDKKGKGVAVPVGETNNRREALELSLMGLVQNPNALEWGIEEE